MRPFTHTIPLREALALALEATTPIARTEDVELTAASGRVLAEPVVAATDVPPFDRAAMDGFAVRADETTGASSALPRALRCVDAIYTGQPPSRALKTGECAQIATGAPVPAGADAVVMVEDTDCADGSAAREFVQILKPVRRGQNVGARAADIGQGEALLGAGDLLTPSRLGACAASGRAAVAVFSRPVVAIASTGNEVVAPGQPLGPAQIYDINRCTLSAVVATHGGLPHLLPPAADDLQALRSLLRETAAFADIIVLSGGSSVGDRDLVLDAVRDEGTVLFHGIAIKPGKPTALGRIGQTPIVAMPGNPASCLVNAYLILVPMLRRMARLPGHSPARVALPLGAAIASAAGRHQFYTVRLDDGRVFPAFKSSGDITSMSRADGYIEIPAGTSAIDAGTPVDVTLF